MRLTSEVVCEVLFWFGAWYSRAFFLYSWFFLSFSFASASSFSAFNWHGANYTLAVVLTLVLVGMSVSVCRDASLQFHAGLWDLMVMIDMSERAARRCSGVPWLTLVSRLRKRVLDHPCCHGDCIPSDTDALLNQPCSWEIIFQARLYSSLCNQTRTLVVRREYGAVTSFWWHEGRLSRDSVVHKLMDAMSSALKLRSAGLTPALPR